jgi:16S rRNA (cytosine1402-N4)-methyltransferase
MEFKHTPVLLNEVIEGLNISPSGFYLDCTLGGAGHSSEIAKRLNKDGILIGFDKDIDAINFSSKRLSEFCNVFIYDKIENVFKSEKISAKSLEEVRVLTKKENKPICVIFKDDFKNSINTLKEMGFPKLNGILIDLGISSYQIDNSERGFSFRSDAPLDMRMDQSQSLTAKEIINTYKEEELAKLFFEYGEEEFSRSIARNIINARNNKEIETTFELRDIIENSMPKKIVYSRGGASKKVFQALRIEVNSELLGLDKFLNSAINYLNKNGRICVISFHSLEDRIVKNIFKELATGCICPPSFPICVCGHKAEISLISKKPIIASEKEQEENSRSLSAKLRIAEKIEK